MARAFSSLELNALDNCVKLNKFTYEVQSLLRGCTFVVCIGCTPINIMYMYRSVFQCWTCQNYSFNIIIHYVSTPELAHEHVRLAVNAHGSAHIRYLQDC